jgi:hypothetical protein
LTLFPAAPQLRGSQIWITVAREIPNTPIKKHLPRLPGRTETLTLC